MNENYNISSSPHIRSKVTTGSIMLYVIIALLPATIFGVYTFGLLELEARPDLCRGALLPFIRQ